MRFVSPVALGLMLAVAGTSLGVAAPAALAKNEAPKLKLTPAFAKASDQAIMALQKKDVEGAKAALAAAEPLAATNEDKFRYFSIMLSLSSLANDGAMQAKAISGMLDSGLVPAEQQGQLNSVAASQDVAAKNYDSAIARAQKAIALGYRVPDNNVTIAQAYFGKAGSSKLFQEPARGFVSQGLAAFKSAIVGMKAAGQAAPAQWYQVAIAKADAADLPELLDWARMSYDSAPTTENFRTLLGSFLASPAGLGSQNSASGLCSREKLDVMRLMSAAGAMGDQRDYLAYARCAADTGMLGEVTSALNAGISAGKLTSAQTATQFTKEKAEIPADKAGLTRAEADARATKNFKSIKGTANAYLSYGNYAKAADLFRLSLSMPNVDANDLDEINTRLGIALSLSGDTAGAKASFAKVTNGTRGKIARLWELWLASKPAA